MGADRPDDPEASERRTRVQPEGEDPPEGQPMEDSAFELDGGADRGAGDAEGASEGDDAPTREDLPGDGTAASTPDRDELGEAIRQRLADHEERGDDDDGDPLIGREVGGRFRIEERIGAGGMGGVYRARQRGMDRDVAVKVLLPHLGQNATVVRRFHMEALAVSRLRNPNTVQIYDFGETDDGQVYIAMEHMEGRSLHAELSEHGARPARQALHVVLQIARSLREAHAKGIIHRDLKPENIFLTSVGEDPDFVKVLDFGVAKIREGDGDGGTLTKTGTIFGTPKYMSPEQGRGHTLDARSDLYALGVMLFEMLTGQAPFDGDSSLGILVQHIQEPAPALDDVRPDLVFPPGIADLVERLLAKQADGRPQSTEALVREIEDFLDQLPEAYRHVVTRDEAVEHGLRTETGSPTRFDTAVGSEQAEVRPTQGPFRDRTLDVPAARRPLRWVAWLAAGLAVLVGGAVAGLYQSLGPLPESVRAVAPLEEPSVGEVPELTPPRVEVTLTSEPSGAVVRRGEERLGETPLRLRAPEGGSARSYTFALDGHRSASRRVAFGSDRTLRVELEEAPTPANATASATASGGDDETGAETEPTSAPAEGAGETSDEAADEREPGAADPDGGEGDEAKDRGAGAEAASDEEASDEGTASETEPAAEEGERVPESRKVDETKSSPYD